ncbi:hypothetical protein [Pseudoalteromonas sp. BSi20495]|uniref:hypothetical protein n=1 Tax=Pseudoalteromonas sp. BSi20495 TaxID=386429 RepID=UPI000231607B|nr:hypothetical protein [Pseudoalteromonas sp. BSi20495]GAA81849.1 hypothetical protein P20495_4393 [Pseudoalteromonas sp. BSi20495]
MKIKNIKPLAIIIVLLTSLLGCQSTKSNKADIEHKQYATYFSEHKNYKDAIANDNKKEAYRALNAMFELSKSNTDYYSLTGNLLASSFVSGAFNKLDEKEFKKIAAVLGDELNLQLKFKIESIEKYYAFKKLEPTKLLALHNDTNKYCQADSIAMRLPITDENEALHYLSSNDCLSDALKDDPNARALYVEYLTYIASRPDMKLRADGFKIYDTSSSQYSALSQEQQSALLSAKEQVFAFSTETKAPNFSLSVKKGELEELEAISKIGELLPLAKSGIAKNYQQIETLFNEIEVTSKQKSKTVPAVLNLLASLALEQRNLIAFDSYVKNMNSAQYLTKENNNYFNQLRLIIFIKSKDYVNGLSYVDTLI